MDKRVIIIILLLFSSQLFGQKITPQAGFQKDSVQIGEEVPYSLWIRYPKSQDVIFPDSLYDFSPFEINKRSYFTTRSDSTESLDSVVYYLSTFEIDTVQYLQLPIFLVDEFDSLELLPNLDSIILDQVVTSIPDSVAVLINTEYQKVPLAFNYPYFTAAIIALLVLSAIVFFVFGGRIKKMLKVYWITRRHKKFIQSFEERISSQSIEVEKSLALWKRYLEKLESVPYTKFTTKEIVRYTNELDLSDQLGIIDRYIYAVQDQPDTKEPFKQLLAFAINRYELKVNQVKHG